MIKTEWAKGLGIVHLRIARRQAADVAHSLDLAQALTRKNGDPGSLWLGPDSWLLVSGQLPASKMIEELRGRLKGTTFNATDNSDALVVLRVVGEGARELLANGCGLDFRIGSFPVGTCKRTRFAQILATISATGENNFELLFDGTYKEYLEFWMASAAEIAPEAAV